MTEFCDLVKNLEAALKSHTDNMASFHSAQPDRLPQELSHASQRYSTTVDSFTDLQAPATHTTHATQALQQQIDTLPSHYARYWSPSLPRSTHSLGDGPNQDVCPPTMNHHETTDVTLPPPESAHTLQQRILELTEQRDAALRQSANWEQAHQKLQADHSRVSHELRQLQLQHPRSISPAEIPGPTVQELQAHIATLEQREQLLRQELTLSQTMLADARKASDVERSRREEEFTTHEQLKAPVRQALSPVTQLSAQVQCHIEILTTELLKARAKHKAERQQWRHRMAFLPSRDSINAITDQSAATPHADVEHVQRQLRAARSMLQPIRTAIFQIQSSHQRLATRCSKSNTTTAHPHSLAHTRQILTRVQHALSATENSAHRVIKGAHASPTPAVQPLPIPITDPMQQSRPQAVSGQLSAQPYLEQRDLLPGDHLSHIASRSSPEETKPHPSSPRRDHHPSSNIQELSHSTLLRSRCSREKHSSRQANLDALLTGRMLDALAIDSLHTALQQQRNHQTAIQAEPQPECERVQARSFHSDLPGSPLRTHAPQTAQSSIDNSFQHLHAVAESRESKFPFIENESEAGEDSEGRQVQVTVSSPFHEVEPDRNRSMAHPTPTQSESGQSDLLRDYRRLAAEHRQCLPQTEKLQKALDAVHRQLEKGTKESVDLLKRLEQLAQSLQMPHPCVEAPPAPGQTANIVAVLHRQVKLIADFILARPSGPSSTVFMRSHGPPDETTWMWHTDSNTWSASKDDSRASSQKLNGQMKAPVQSPPHDTRASNVRANQRQAPPTSRRNSLTPHQPVLSPIEEGPSLPGSPFRPSMSAAPISSSLLQSIAGHIDWEAVGL